MAADSVTATFSRSFLAGRKRFGVRAAYAFIAPTGKFAVDGTDNVGAGYWTQAGWAGETFYLTKNRATAISAYQMYEFHSTQEGTQVHPGQTFNLDYSLTRVFPVASDLRLQLGVGGYGQWQTTDKSGPEVTPEQAANHYLSTPLAPC